MKGRCWLPGIMLGFCLVSYRAIGAVAGTFTVGEATVHCIGLEWQIGNDSNGNASVAVYYRRSGTSTWIQAMDMRRINRSYQTSSMLPPSGSVLFAGSIFDLEEDTDYDVRAVLSDPDGGGTEHIDTVRTWKEPQPPAPVRTLYVTPGSGGGAGTAGDPFRGLAEADANAQPGDLIIIGGGTYSGMFEVTVPGTESFPIVYRAADGETPVIDANWDNNGLRLVDMHDLFFEGITVRRTDWGMLVRRCQRITIRRCTVENVHHGIDASQDETNYKLWISDCSITGLIDYPRNGQSDWRGIQIGGRKNVVCHNYVQGFYDGIDTSNYHPSKDMDIYLNDINECVDDGMELDFTDCNNRAYRNRLTNCFQGISFQPIYGGPAYAIRNSIFNLDVEPFKLHANGSDETSGAVILHNTICRYDEGMFVSTTDTIHDTVVRNNLFVFRDSSYSLYINYADNLSFDYNVYCRDSTNFFARWEGTQYNTSADLYSAAGQEEHAVIFGDHHGVFDPNIDVPWDDQVSYQVSENDLRLIATSPAIDAAEPLPNINDGYQGAAPDAGCYEYGAAVPDYGPRTPGGSITVGFPNGGETLVGGNNVTITWTSSNFSGNVKIEFYNGSGWSDITTSTADDGSYSWTAPAIDASGCMVRISDAADGVPSDTSNTGFSINTTGESITVTYPSGSLAFQTGMTVTIAWTSSNFTGSMQIEYFDGSGWNVITSSTPDDGSYSWTVPEISANNCRIRVSDASDGSPSGTSSGTFIVYFSKRKTTTSCLAAGSRSGRFPPEAFLVLLLLAGLCLILSGSCARNG